MTGSTNLDVISLARALIRIPSASGGEAALAAYVAEVMAGFGFDAVKVDAWGNVIGSRHGKEPGPTILFDGHMDVVDPGPEPWQSDPFGGEIAGDRLYGRGAADTKGSLAAMLCAASSATLPTDRLRGDVIVAATVCEENLTGAALGHVLDDLRPHLVITGEPTALRLGVAQKGRATVRLHASGRSSHTSRPDLGDNAAYKMIEAISRLRSLPRAVDAELGPGVLELVELASEPLPNLTLVPAGCHARFVARTLPGETPGSFIGSLAAALSDLPGVTLSIETLRQRCYTGAELEAVDFLPPWRCPPDDPWRVRVLTALTLAGLPPETFAAPCGTNASESAGRRGIPSFILGPGTLGEAHIADEWVAVTQLISAQKCYAAIIASTA